MPSSAQLRERLIAVTGYSNVYLKPPPKDLMVYPCIRVERVSAKVKHADDTAYNVKYRYTITRISKKDDEGFPKLILENFANSDYDRSYVAEGLYHDVLYIYY